VRSWLLLLPIAIGVLLPRMTLADGILPGAPAADGGVGATVLFSMIIATCLTLASIYGLVWLKQRDAWANVMFSLLAIGTAGMAGCELGMMRSVSTEAFGAMLRGYQVAVWITIVGFVGFVRSYLKTDRVWLGGLVLGARTLTLFPNFIGGAVNVNYREITSLVRIPFLGEGVSVPVGVPNPWMVLAQFSLVLLLAYVTDAAVTCWRLGDRRRAVTVGGGLMVFIGVGITQSILVFWGLVRMPLSASVFFLGMVLVMGFELSRDVLNAGALSKELKAQHRELAHMSRVSAMGVLSASIAHELNQPLTAILSNAQAGQRFLAAPEPDLAEVREILKDIATEDVRAGNVIRGLRAMMKNEPLRRERLDANQIIETVLLLLHAESALRNVVVQKRLAAELPIILGDQVQLQQVVLNLLMNALEAMDALSPGSGCIEVSTDAAEAGWVRIRVSDSGPGIPAEKLAGIFEPFVTTKSAGMGMGLSVCRSIVAASGGRIRANNDPGGGATFTVELPTHRPTVSVA